MIPMACPSCGRRGNVPPDKLNARLHCKKCDAVFYMDMSGNIVLGNPPSSTSSGKSSAVIPTRRDEPVDLIGDLVEAVTSIPKGVRIGIAAVAGLVLVYWLIGKIGLFGEPVPTSLIDRSTYAAEAWVDGKGSWLRSLAVSGTEADVDKWLESTRSEFGEYGEQGPGNDVIVASRILSGGDAGTKAVTHSMLTPPLKLKSSTVGQIAEPYDLPIAWAKQGGEWRIDGKATLTTPKPEPTNRRRTSDSARAGMYGRRPPGR